MAEHSEAQACGLEALGQNWLRQDRGREDQLEISIQLSLLVRKCVRIVSVYSTREALVDPARVSAHYPGRGAWSLRQINEANTHRLSHSRRRMTVFRRRTSGSARACASTRERGHRRRAFAAQVDRVAFGGSRVQGPAESLEYRVSHQPGSLDRHELRAGVNNHGSGAGRSAAVPIVALHCPSRERQKKPGDRIARPAVDSCGWLGVYSGDPQEGKPPPSTPRKMHRPTETQPWLSPPTAKRLPPQLPDALRSADESSTEGMAVPTR